MADAHRGEVGIELAPALELDADAVGFAAAARIDELLRRSCDLARALTGAEQAALNLCVTDDEADRRKYFSLSARYSGYRDYRVNPLGLGLHGIAIPAGEVVRLTQAEVEAHPAWQAFGTEVASHPPLRGWLALAVCGPDEHRYGLLQLSDKAAGADFSVRDGELVLELAGVVGAALDALRVAHS